MILCITGYVGLCPSHQVNCYNGQQIPSEWLCDGDNDCGDGSDEFCSPTSRSLRGNWYFILFRNKWPFFY